MKLLQTIYQKKVEFDKIMFCVELYFPKAAEAVRSRQLQNDQLTFQQISRVCIDLMFFREIWSEHSPIDKEQNGAGEFFYFQYFSRGGL